MTVFDSIVWPVPVTDDPDWDEYPQDVRDYWYSLRNIKKDERMQLLREYIYNRNPV